MSGHLLWELFVDPFENVYLAEHRFLELLPRMAKATQSSDLRSELERHLEPGGKEAPWSEDA